MRTQHVGPSVCCQCVLMHNRHKHARTPLLSAPASHTHAARWSHTHRKASQRAARAQSELHTPAAATAAKGRREGGTLRERRAQRAARAGAAGSERERAAADVDLDVGELAAAGAGVGGVREVLCCVSDGGAWLQRRLLCKCGASRPGVAGLRGGA